MMRRQKTIATDRRAKSLNLLPLIPEEDKDPTSQASQGSFDNIDPADLPKRIEPIDLPNEIDPPKPDKIESSDSSYYCSTTEKMTSEDNSKKELEEPSNLNELPKNLENEENSQTTKRKRDNERSTNTVLPANKRSKRIADTKHPLHRSSSSFWKPEDLSTERALMIGKKCSNRSYGQNISKP